LSCPAPSAVIIELLPPTRDDAPTGAATSR
jgi:hypothetical protein